MRRTIVVAETPVLRLSETGHFPEFLSSDLRVFETLLDFDALVSLEGSFVKESLVLGGHESLVAATVFVIDVFAYDLPVGDVEDLLAEYFVGVVQAIEDEPGN